MEYNRQTITGLDPRQLVYIKMHNEQYGTENLVIDGKTYIERCQENRPTDAEIKKALCGYEDREAYLDCNMRGWALIFRTESNEDLRSEEAWDSLKKIN